ncbi:MAG: dihydroneopterin aldolase [Acidimicrobiales bacterium]|nr:dihydroneopterin aldolase [Acidimicrobiales bacterium]
MATDTIQLRDLRLMCLCGALPEEQDRQQPYAFDIDLVAELPATMSDRLEETVDYGAVLDRIEAVTSSEAFQLFERMAERIAEEMLRFDRVVEVTVEVRKLRPPVAQDLGSSGIRLTRRRG